MGIPIKKSRPVEVDGQMYRWMIREGKPRRKVITGFASHSIMMFECRILTVQKMKEDKPEGQILQLSLYWMEPDALNEIAFFPEDARRIVRLALEKGWNPDGEGVCKDLQIQAGMWETVVALIDD